MNMTFRPISTWPGERTRTSAYPRFKASYRDTLGLLDRELLQLNAKNIVLECDVEERHIRLDGQLRSDAQPRSPGIVLSFDSKHGPLRYACDAFNRWQANLRAIALGLEALRKVERYGITKRGEQYTGWKQLGSGIALGPGGFASREDAARFIAEHAWDDSSYAEDVLTDGQCARDGYLLAAKKLHPDAGGDPELFKRLQQARATLGIT